MSLSKGKKWEIMPLFIFQLAANSADSIDLKYV